MQIRKIIQRQFRGAGAGKGTVGSVNAAIAANVNEPGHSHTSVSSKQRIVQRGGRTVVHEERRTEGESK